MIPPCRGGPASNEVAELTQPDGSRFRARLQGDEWFNWNETEDGYVIGKDTDGRWKYRRPRQDRAAFDFVPDAPVGKLNPAALGLRRHDLPPRALIHERLRTLRDPGRPFSRALLSSGTAASASAQTGPEASVGDSPPPSPAPPASNNLRCIVILASFADHWDAGTSAPLTSRGKPRADYDALFNTPGYSGDGATGSARDYYHEVSYGRTDITFIVSDWVQLPQNEAYYGDNANEVSGAGRARNLAADALAAADTAGFDFSAGDGNNDGWADLVVVIYSGFSEAIPANPSTCVWPRQWSLPAMETRDGKKMSAFAITSAMRGLQSSSTGIMRIGTLVHEMGHLFGLSDLYDLGSVTKGIGAWGLMGYGGWGASGGSATESRPTHMEAFSKMLLGYLDPQPAHSCAEHSLPRLASSPSAHVLRGSGEDPEYFLIENRGGSGFDAGLPSGLLITHIDARVVTAANNSSLFETPAIRVEEADGGDTLRTSAIASTAHVWTATNGLAGGFRDITGDPETNAMRYQAGGTYPYTRTDNPAFHTGIVVTDFSPAGALMTYRLQTRVPTIEPAVAPASSYTVTWSAASAATSYELQEGTATTVTTFFDDAESLAALRDHWQIFGAVGHSTLGNATPGGTACYELASKLPGPDALINTTDDYFMPEYRGLALRAPFTLTASSALSFKFLSQRASGRGDLRIQLTRDDGLTWTTLATYDGFVTAWTTVTLTYALLESAGFSAGDVCRLRFLATSEQLWGWSGFPAYGYALDDIELTGILRDATSWTTISADLTVTGHTIAGKTDGSSWRYRVRAYSDSVWREWSPVATVTVNYSPLASWRQTHFGTTDNTGVAADTFDPDGDGLSNLLEYAVGGDPINAASAPAPVPQVSGSHLQLSFFRVRSELDYTVEASSDLAAWSTLATNPGSVSITTPVTVTDAVSLSDSPRRFLRLRISYE
jgi:M6 family metalloprotease-like protein